MSSIWNIYRNRTFTQTSYLFNISVLLSISFRTSIKLFFASLKLHMSSFICLVLCTSGQETGFCSAVALVGKLNLYQTNVSTNFLNDVINILLCGAEISGVSCYCASFELQL